MLPVEVTFNSSNNKEMSLSLKTSLSITSMPIIISGHGREAVSSDGSMSPLVDCLNESHSGSEKFVNTGRSINTFQISKKSHNLLARFHLDCCEYSQ